MQRSALNVWLDRYKTFALLLTNTLLLLLLLNAVLWAGLTLYTALKSKRFQKMREAYPAMNNSEFAALYAETWTSGFEYAPWVGFREKPHAGSYVNVTSDGFRRTHRRDLNLDAEGLNVYVFGGSTTFGYGVPDGDTIPAQLQLQFDALYPGRRINVFNFGRGSYYFTQEVSLLEQLLREGHTPDAAIFIDGLNEGQTAPGYTEELRSLFEASSYHRSALLQTYMSQTSTALVLKKLARRTQDAALISTSLTPETIRASYNNNREIVRMLAAKFGFRTHFFIQPIPGYRNSFGRHPYLPNGWPAGVGEHLQARMTQLEEEAHQTDTVSIAGVLADYPEQPFCDKVHYTPAVCKLIARTIAGHIKTLEPRARIVSAGEP